MPKNMRYLGKRRRTFSYIFPLIIRHCGNIQDLKCPQPVIVWDSGCSQSEPGDSASLIVKWGGIQSSALYEDEDETSADRQNFYPTRSLSTIIEVYCLMLRSYWVLWIKLLGVVLNFYLLYLTSIHEKRS